MGRKRNQGKARKAAKAKAREEEEVTRKKNNFEEALTAEERRIYFDDLKRRTQFPCQAGSVHGAVPVVVGVNDICCHFATAFSQSFYKSAGLPLWDRLIGARDAAMDGFANVVNDSAKLETVMSYLLCDGVQLYLEGSYNLARDTATMSRYFEQFIAIKLKRTQAIFHRPKLSEIYQADEHTLVKFYRNRIPCSCLDKKYEEVKHIKKMGICWNPQCSIPGRNVARSNTKYCSRCRSVAYCSRECQVADWTEHKLTCDWAVATTAEFEASQQKCK